MCSIISFEKVLREKLQNQWGEMGICATRNKAQSLLHETYEVHSVKIQHYHINNWHKLLFHIDSMPKKCDNELWFILHEIFKKYPSVDTYNCFCIEEEEIRYKITITFILNNVDNELRKS